MNRRHDRISAMFIEAVLDASRHHGTARLLHEDGVSFDVALRVLTRPGGRRLAPRPPHVLVAAAAAVVRPFGAAHPHRRDNLQTNG
ncbi:hypothetical protein [Massilia sp. CT11-137]|uniref:hypothetical protein n=1 Tax=Massilia sp. CT11-137 TaxID=3393901 RepID=UPI0039B0A2E9